MKHSSSRDAGSMDESERTRCLLPYSDTREYERFSARGVFLGTTQGSSAPACTRGADADPLVVDIKDHRCVVGAHQHMAISQVW